MLLAQIKNLEVGVLRITRLSFSKDRTDEVKETTKADDGGMIERQKRMGKIFNQTRQQMYKALLMPRYNSLSPSETQVFKQQFTDISKEDKEILDGIARKIVELNTATFYDVFKGGALGTSQVYYTATEVVSEEELPDRIKIMRKEK